MRRLPSASKSRSCGSWWNSDARSKYSPNGVSDATLLADGGFLPETLPGLVLAGFTTAVTETIGQAIKVERHRLTAAAEGRCRSDAQSGDDPAQRRNHPALPDPK
jgi:hypothetical protein